MAFMADFWTVVFYIVCVYQNRHSHRVIRKTLFFYENIVKEVPRSILTSSLVYVYP